jgi:hypothetical protein
MRRKVLTRVFPCFRLIYPFLSRWRSSMLMESPVRRLSRKGKEDD